MEQFQDFGHGFRQPLNNIGLTVANMRMRLERSFGDDDRAYLLGKLDRIEEQLERAIRALEGVESLEPVGRDGPSGSK